MANLLESSDENRSTPVTLSLRDVILVLAAVISMVTAWGMFGTRLSIVEEKIITISSTISEIRLLMKDVKIEHKSVELEYSLALDNIRSRLRIIETNQAQLSGMLRAREVLKNNNRSNQ